MAVTINGTSGVTFPDSTVQSTADMVKAWVNFAGSSGSKNASYNVSSVTRNSTGDYTVNFSNSLVDANYSVVFGIPADTGSFTSGGRILSSTASSAPTTMTSSSVRMVVGSNGSVDPNLICVAVFR